MQWPCNYGPHLPESRFTINEGLHGLIVLLVAIQAEGAAIAAAVFASVSQAEPHQASPGQEGHGLPEGEPGRPRARARKPKRRADASPENAEDTLRMKAEAARIAAEAFAVIPQASWRWQHVHALQGLDVPLIAQAAIR